MEVIVIIVTGASGQLGRGIVDRLLDRVPAEQVGVSVREPAKAGTLHGRGVRVRRGDFTDAASLAHAFEGATQVLIVSANATGGTAVSAHRAAIDAAKAAGAARILYTSHVGASPTSPFAPMPDHAETEAALRDSGVAFTSLRNGFYATTVPLLLRGALQTGDLAAPEDAPVSWTAHADLAEAAAVALTGHEALDGITPALTAAQPIDLTGIAEMASELTGRPIRRVVVPDAAYRDALVANGVPESVAEMLMGMFAASRQGDFAAVDPTLSRVIGHAPTPLQDVLKEAIATAS